MRKLFWCGAAGLVACAAAVHAVADHAANHPDSYLGRCVGTAASIGLRANPFVAMNPLVDNPIFKSLAQQLGAVAGWGATAQAALFPVQQACANACKPEADAVAEQEEQAIPQEFEPADHVQPFEPIKVEQTTEEPIKVEDRNWVEDHNWIIDDVLPEPGMTVPTHVIPTETEEPRTGDVEESEPPLSEGEVPPMPYVEEECEGTGVCPIDENGCNKWLLKLLQMGGIVGEMTADDAEEVPLPTPCDDEEQGTESSATPDAQEPATETEMPLPGSQDDPAYHEHYHGCPYMGGCPYPHSCPAPSVVPSEEPQEPQQPQGEDAAPKTKCKHSKKKPCEESGFLKKSWFHLGGCTGQSGVDTMEFRPSDDPRESPGNAPF